MSIKQITFWHKPTSGAIQTANETIERLLSAESKKEASELLAYALQNYAEYCISCQDNGIEWTTGLYHKVVDGKVEKIDLDRF